ncbi:hypothetical protein LJC25_02955 [Bacteroidales bacterium OttesenSCG-928-K03]|nr:hypothetical protein [Bacteroidales bacterium OttesenSCG-928-L14]MDL2242668.1 hypothetical protein [Bacteroidales bacterium OttesenSCG-928-K03]
MKKLHSLLLIIFISFTSPQLFSQTNVFTVGTSNLNIGFNLPSYSKNLISPPISVSYDYGIVDFGKNAGSIGIGGYIGYSISREKYYISGTEFIDFYNHLYIGPRVSYHFNGIPNVPQLDLYSHLLIGVLIDIERHLHSRNVYTESYFAADFKIGGKYWFKDTFGVFLEIGWGSISALELGVSFKFN